MTEQERANAFHRLQAWLEMNPQPFVGRRQVVVTWAGGRFADGTPLQHRPGRVARREDRLAGRVARVRAAMERIP